MPNANTVTKLRIASRESALALWQSNHIKSELEALYPDLEVEIVGMTTKVSSQSDTALFIHQMIPQSRQDTCCNQLYLQGQDHIYQIYPTEPTGERQLGTSLSVPRGPFHP